jgi:peptidoglycan/LPS O-acetylase OafA/YrhL
MEKRIYFKNLSALRFIAATLVIFHHVEQYKLWAGLPNIFANTAILALGHKAVSFFFVLSGFLITFLLLTEERQKGKIDVHNFYIRRILRIWPLYYFIVFLCLFVLPNIFDLSVFNSEIYNRNFPLVTALLLLVLPNLVRLFQPVVVGGNQLWSIGVEEQFYLVWPLLVRWFVKSMIAFLLAFIAVKLVVTIVLEEIALTHSELIYQKAFRFWELLQVEQMAIGAVGAWVLFNRKQSIINFIYHPAIHLASICMAGLLFILPVHHWWINYAEAAVFTVVIINLSTNPAIRLNLENKVFGVLGNISYGIYMYHTLCIAICFYSLRQLGWQESHYVIFNALLYILSITTTITLAYFSYEYFEKKFLELKEKYMVVKSGKQATTLAVPAREGIVVPKVVVPAPEVRETSKPL